MERILLNPQMKKFVLHISRALTALIGFNRCSNGEDFPAEVLYRFLI